MATIPLDALEPQLSALIRRVEQGETIVVTRDGKPVFDLVPRPRKGGFDLETGRAYLREHGLPDPLPENLLLKPLPV